MRKLCFLVFLFSTVIFAQENQNANALEVNFLRGNVLPHTDDLYHLLGHPEGVLLSYSVQTRGKKEWHKAYNYPDYGAYFLFQDFKNPFLGKNYSLGMHYNFYFLHRNFNVKVGQGIAYNTNPYNKVSNSKNNSFGSKLAANINLGVFYKKEYILEKIGLQAGLLLTHYSNGRTKSPNSGINTFLVNVGLNYNFDEKKPFVIDTTYVPKKYKEAIKFNFVARVGFNESQVIGSGQYPFYHVGFYADKRISRKSGLQLGTELFLTTSFKDYIKYRAVAFPELNIDPNTDYKRVGVFVGHELYINKISLEAQLGVYVYDPFKNEIPVYDRLGIKYYINDKIFAGVSIKTHVFLAEALEFGVGIQL